MNIKEVLLITDDHESARMLAHGLVMRGVQVDIAAISSHLHQRDEIARYTLVIVDTDRTDGVVLCRQLRSDYHNPLLFLTYERDERYQLLVYEAGVDDCIQKPIGNSLFLAKVDVWLRATHFRNSGYGQRAQNFQLDLARRQLALPEGRVVTLTQLEIRLVELFLSNPNITLETGTIIRRVWNDYCEGDSTLLKNLIYRVRRKIESAPHEPQYIQTTFGGYIFRTDSIQVE